MKSENGICGIGKYKILCDLKGFIIEFTILSLYMNIIAFINFYKQIILNDHI